ncbi:hypothetical protein A2U01_0112677, partial [Trifolium medium]|nr:hypothetical protein [Trifolium medium]
WILPISCFNGAARQSRLCDAQHPEVYPTVAPRSAQRATYHCAARRYQKP